MKNNWLDIQHRGYSAYLHEVAGDDTCKRLNSVIARADRSHQQADMVLLDCRVDTDWIERIEAALPLVESAVRQNRQFILRQGESVPIEKARRVSKDSVVHLSRHSELITTEPASGGELIPEKIYMTENITTYDVYENRFLYMLLCYIRDFTELRYQRILELAASCSSNISMRKEITDGSRRISYCLQFSETSRGMEGIDTSEAEAEIGRIQQILQSVEQLLKTDLMKEVSAAPMLKPPIVRNNVMLHSPNFQAAFELYAYLDAYTKDGYEKLQRYRSDGGFSDEMNEDFSALVAMTSYLAYRGTGLREALDERYLDEERRRSEAEKQAMKERCDALRAKLGQLSEPAQAYILALEQRVGSLEDQTAQIQAAQALQAEAEGKLQAAQERIGSLQTACAGLDLELRKKNAELRDLTGQSQAAVAAAQQQLQRMELECEQARQRFDAALERQRQEFLQEYETLGERYRLANARYRGLVQKSGGEEEPCLTKEAFAELEAEYEAFQRYFDRQWKMVKKQIRKEKLWKK